MFVFLLRSSDSSDSSDRRGPVTRTAETRTPRTMAGDAAHDDGSAAVAVDLRRAAGRRTTRYGRGREVVYFYKSTKGCRRRRRQTLQNHYIHARSDDRVRVPGDVAAQFVGLSKFNLAKVRLGRMRERVCTRTRRSCVLLVAFFFLFRCRFGRTCTDNARSRLPCVHRYDTAARSAPVTSADIVQY